MKSTELELTDEQLETIVGGWGRVSVDNFNFTYQKNYASADTNATIISGGGSTVIGSYVSQSNSNSTTQTSY